MNQIALNDQERLLLERSADLEVTKRRMRSVVVFAGGLCALILGWILTKRAPEFLNWLFLLYVGVTAYERLRYGSAILQYKQLIQKLQNQIDAYAAQVNALPAKE
jgi:hypothetical protein